METDIEQIKEELKLPQIPQYNLQPYTAVKARNKGMHIGVLKESIQSLTSYKKGDIVLYTPYTVEESYGKMLWSEMLQHCKLCTIESPASLYIKDDSNTFTVKTIVGVPLSCIEYEIVV